MFSINYSYRGGVDSEGRPVMVVVGAHFLLRCLDIERFVLYVVKVIKGVVIKSIIPFFFLCQLSWKCPQLSAMTFRHISDSISQLCYFII
jgi:hypothetical protein